MTEKFLKYTRCQRKRNDVHPVIWICDCHRNWIHCFVIKMDPIGSNFDENENGSNFDENGSNFDEQSQIQITGWTIISLTLASGVFKKFFRHLYET